MTDGKTRRKTTLPEGGSEKARTVLGEDREGEQKPSGDERQKEEALSGRCWFKRGIHRTIVAERVRTGKR